MRRRFVCHPRRYASDRAVGLRNNDQLSTTVGILLSNEHGLAAPGMKRVVNPPLDRVSAGSMSLLRGLLSALAYVLVRTIFPEGLWPRVFGLFAGVWSVSV